MSTCYVCGSRWRQSIVVAVANICLGESAIHAEPVAEPDHAGLEEIVVTAQKRAENIQKVPLAITAMGADELQQRGITGVAALQGGQVPALRIQPNGGNPTQLELAIRGIQNPNGQDITQENPVPIYIDDVYNGRQQGTALELTEIDHLEVLRGPQGTLFGKNAMGGAVRIVSKEPTGIFGLRSSVEAGNFGYWKANAHLDLPSVADIAAKIDLLATDNNGWAKNPGPGQQDFARNKTDAARVALLWTPLDDLKIEYAGDWNRSRSTMALNQQIATTDPYSIGVWPDQRTRQDRSFYPVYRPLDPQEFYGHRITLNWTVNDALAVRSISAYRHDKQIRYGQLEAASNVPGAFLGSSYGYLSGVVPVYNVKHDQLSEELQLIGTHQTVNWVAGLFAMREHGRQINNTFFGTGFPNAVTTGTPFFLPVAVGPGVALDPPFAVGGPTGATIRNISAGLFAQATWRPEIMESKFSFTGGIRFSYDDKEAARPSGVIYDAVTYPAPGQATAPPVGTGPGDALGQICPCSSKSISEHRVLPMAVVAYDWTNDVTTYLKYSTGYRAAAFGLTSQTFNPVKSDTVKSFELGVKSELFDRRVRLNAALFEQRWENTQQNVQTVDNSTVEFFNGPTETVKGVEVDAQIAPVQDVTVSINGAYNSGHIGTAQNPYPNPNGSTVSYFNQLVQLPKWSGSVALAYDVAHLSFGTLRFNADWNVTSSFYSVPNTATAIAGYGLVNARLTLTQLPLGSSNQQLDVFLWGRNLLNKDYRTFVYDAPGVAGINTDASFGEPRTYGAGLNYRF